MTRDDVALPDAFLVCQLAAKRLGPAEIGQVIGGVMGMTPKSCQAKGTAGINDLHYASVAATMGELLFGTANRYVSWFKQ